LGQKSYNESTLKAFRGLSLRKYDSSKDPARNTSAFGGCTDKIEFIFI